MNVIIMGPPGSGKSTQAKKLAEKLGAIRIASGDISRQIASENTDDGKAVREIMNSGGLTPDDILFRHIRKIFDTSNLSRGVVMDGYPRNEEQIFLVEKMLAEKKMIIDKVVMIDLSKEEAIKRLLGRAKQESRADDNIEVIQNRFDVYSQSTRPIINYYASEGKLVHVDGHPGIEEIFITILSVLKISS